MNENSSCQMNALGNGNVDIEIFLSVVSYY